jgi:hypothetical protein
MRDKGGWDLTKKQREKYLDGIKMLYGGPGKGQAGIVPPRVSVEDLELVHEKPLCREEVGQGQLSIAELPVPRRTSKPKVRKEWREQEEIYKWTQTIQPLRGFVMMIGNESKRNVVQAAVAKRMGLLSGASDLFIAKPVGMYHGLWLEVKKNCTYTPSQRGTDHWKRQEEFQERMRSVGFAATFCFGADEGIGIIKKYLKQNSSD